MTTKRILRALLTTIATVMAPAGAMAQAPAASPEAIAEAFLRALHTDPAHPRDLDILPATARDWIVAAAADSLDLAPGFARVVHRAPDRAVLVLAAHPLFGNTGSETSASRAVSGFYEVVRRGGGWRSGDRLPLDAGNRILEQRLDVRIRPGLGLDVIDTLTVAVGDPAGFAVRLNHAVALDTVRLATGPAPHAFGGGLLWVDLQPGEHHLVLEYSVDVARDSATDPNSGHFAPRFGHVRNQYFWHPFFDFQSLAQNVPFSIRVSAPADAWIATDLPQTETVVDGRRVVHARSREPTFALSLFYDRNWEPTERDVEGFRLVRFATPGTPPSPDTLVAAFRRSYATLADSFGPPRGGYLAVVQARARQGSGWLFRSNDALVTPADGGSSVSRSGGWPRAWFGHELAHGWTRPTGPAANFLREGWATFAEAILLGEEYDRATVDRFWEMERARYFLAFDGESTILDDPSNQGIAYAKGAWVLRMLRNYVGPAAFARGFADYMSIPVGEPAGHEEFAGALEAASGMDVAAFLRPWLTESRAPAVTAAVKGDQLVLRQLGPVHVLPLELEIHGAGGSTTHRVVLTRRTTSLPLDSLEVHEVQRVDLDPRRRLLIRRNRGDRVVFVYTPEEGQRPESVRLEGLFLETAAEAELQANGSWSVERELAEGIYPYWWRVDASFVGPIRSVEVEPAGPITPDAFGGPEGARSR